MRDQVKVTFRGMERREDLVRSAQAWTAAIRDGLPRTRSLEALVFIHRCAPRWGASTTVQVDLSIDGRQITEFARSEDPYDAVQGSFVAVAQRLRPASLSGRPIVTQSSIRGWLRDGSEEPCHPF